MPGAFMLDLAIIAGVIFTCWRFRKNPRIIAAGFLLGAFLAAMAVPPLTAAIAARAATWAGMAILVALDIYGLGVAVHEIITGEHHHPVRTPFSCMTGGLAIAATWVDWPQVTHRISHLPSQTGKALGHNATTARHLAHAHGMTAISQNTYLAAAAAAVIAVTLLLWYSRRRRVTAAQAGARTDEEAARLAAAAAAAMAARPLREIAGVRHVRGLRATLRAHKANRGMFRGAPAAGRPAGAIPQGGGYAGPVTSRPAVTTGKRGGK